MQALRALADNALNSAKSTAMKYFYLFFLKHICQAIPVMRNVFQL